jgi:hypothetical protein
VREAVTEPEARVKLSPTSQKFSAVPRDTLKIHLLFQRQDAQAIFPSERERRALVLEGVRRLCSSVWQQVVSLELH